MEQPQTLEDSISYMTKIGPAPDEPPPAPSPPLAKPRPAAAAPSPVRALDRDLINDLALSMMATDLIKDNDALVEEMLSTWTLDDATAFFESDGSYRPKPKSVPHAPRTHERALLCLHSSMGCGAILKAQLMPLKLHESFDMDFLDGSIEVDPAVQPEAKMLREFFPDYPNRSYMRMVEVDEASGEEKEVLLATNTLAAGANGGDISMGLSGAKASRREYRGVEAALQSLAHTIARAHQQDKRYDGVVAFSQGGNLLTMLLALLEAAEAAAAKVEAEAAAAPAGPDKAAGKAAARAAADVAAKRSRVLRPPYAILFSSTDFGWTSQLADGAFAARCLAALDLGIAQARPGGTAAAPLPTPLSSLASVFGDAPISKCKALAILGQADPSLEAGRKLAKLFAPSACILLVHSEGHKIPAPRKDAALCQRVLNFAKLGVCVLAHGLQNQPHP